MADKEYVDFSPESDAGKILFEWWESLDKNRGERAQLRRCGNLTEVAFVPSYHYRLLNKLGRVANVSREKLAAVAGILSHVKKHDGKDSFAEQMATPKTGDGKKARVSDLRFRRFLKNEDYEELFPAVIRIVRMLDGKANIFNLANDVYWWKDRTKKKWAYKYYAKAPEK